MSDFMDGNQRMLQNVLEGFQEVMVCTAPAASGHFYQLTERNSEMRETSLASFHIETFCKKYHEHIRAMIVAMAKMKVSFVRILHLLQEPDHQHMCRERIHVRV